MNNITNENIKVYNKKQLLFKFVLLLILIFIDIKLKNVEKKFFYERNRKNPKLAYYYIDLDPYKESINLEEGGKLEIFNNNYTNETSKINTKSSGPINKTDIVFLVIPGGSYRKLGEVESLPIAKKFFYMGYSSALLSYSVAPSSYPTFYNQGLESIKILSQKFKKIIIIGFSAGGHLAGMLGTSSKDKLYNTIGMILCYPVISFENKVHKFSRANFFGKKYKDNAENRKIFSVNNRVTNDTIPTFIWTIKNDKTVPYENTLAMIESLKKYGIRHEYKIYPKGVHGMALADEFDIRYGNPDYKNDKVAQWINLAVKFFEEILKES